MFVAQPDACRNGYVINTAWLRTGAVRSVIKAVISRLSEINRMASLFESLRSVRGRLSRLVGYGILIRAESNAILFLMHPLYAKK